MIKNHLKKDLGSTMAPLPGISDLLFIGVDLSSCEDIPVITVGRRTVTMDGKMGLNIINSITGDRARELYTELTRIGGEL